MASHPAYHLISNPPEGVSPPGNQHHPLDLRLCRQYPDGKSLHVHHRDTKPHRQHPLFSRRLLRCYGGKIIKQVEKCWKQRKPLGLSWDPPPAYDRNISNWYLQCLDDFGSTPTSDIEPTSIRKPPNSEELGGFLVAEAGLEPTTSGL